MGWPARNFWTFWTAALEYRRYSRYTRTAAADNRLLDRRYRGPGAVAQNESVVLRLQPAAGTSLPVPCYITGLRYSTFTGGQWLPPAGGGTVLFPDNGLDVFTVAQETPDLRTTVFLEPTGTDVLFGPGQVTGVHGAFVYLREDMEGGLHLPRGQDQTIRYDVASLAGVSVPAGTQDEKRYLQLPPLSAAFRAVAARARAGRHGRRRLMPCGRTSWRTMRTPWTRPRPRSGISW